MDGKNIKSYILIGITVILGFLAVLLAQRIYQLRMESIAPTAPKSKPKAVDEQPAAQCTLNFSLQQGPTNTPTVTPTQGLTSTPTITPTPGGPTATVTPTAPPGPTNTPTPGPTLAPLSCNSTCDTNNNKCPSDAPYCIDYEGDDKGPICGTQTIAGNGPKCEKPQPGCGEICDVNNNKCTADAPYCIDYSTDLVGAICGKQNLANEEPNCQVAEGPTPTPISMPPAGTVENTIFAVIGGFALIIAGFLFL